MSELENKAKEYADKLKNYESLNIKPLDLGRYHAISEQKVDLYMSKLEEALQEDTKKIPDIIAIYNKILSPFKRKK